MQVLLQVQGNCPYIVEERKHWDLDIMNSGSAQSTERNSFYRDANMKILAGREKNKTFTTKSLAYVCGYVLLMSFLLVYTSKGCAK